MPDGAPDPEQITPESIYLRRRQFLRGGVFAAVAGLLPLTGHSLVTQGKGETKAQQTAPEWLQQKVADASSADSERPDHSTKEDLTPYEDATSYNNFYEFGQGKRDPFRRASDFEPHPWTVQVDGLVENPGTYSLEDLLQPHQLEERIYRLRCVEAWSMVIPWIGLPLKSLLERLGPLPGAKFVAFETLHDPERMPAQGSFFSTIDWPYREGLRLDEAMHPLTLLAVGMYGKALPGQNGAPLRLVVPWKYGFKSIKSIVRITVLKAQPATTWNQLQPREYGFYANVNPDVSHPRWSQSRERRLSGKQLFPRRIPTLMFNGYADQVAHLYKGMDLARHY